MTSSKELIHTESTQSNDQIGAARLSVKGVASETTSLPVATVQLKTVSTVNDCHCHGYNLR